MSAGGVSGHPCGATGSPAAPLCQTKMSSVKQRRRVVFTSIFGPIFLIWSRGVPCSLETQTAYRPAIMYSLQRGYLALPGNDNQLHSGPLLYFVSSIFHSQRNISGCGLTSVAEIAPAWRKKTRPFRVTSHGKRRKRPCTM